MAQVAQNSPERQYKPRRLLLRPDVFVGQRYQIDRFK